MFEQASNEDSVEGYSEYLLEYPNGHYSKKARAHLQDLLFNEINTSKSFRAFDLYLEQFPDGKHSDEVKALHEEALYLYARETQSFRAYRRYRDEYPDGKHIQEVKTYIREHQFEAANIQQTDEERDWKLTRSLDSFFQYSWFIEQYPNSPHTEEAIRLRESKRQALENLKE